jgi:hypothetical protein
MNTLDPGDDLFRAARLSRQCTAMRHAAALAGWIGNEARPVTAGMVLRRADVPVAGAVLGVPVPARVRTAVDVRQLHRPWCLALAAGWLRIDEGTVEASPPREQVDEDVLDYWLAGLQAVCAAESPAHEDDDSVRLLARALLTVLAEADVGTDSGGAPRTGGLTVAVRERLRELCELHDKSFWEVVDAQARYDDPGTDEPLDGLVTLLAEFGAIVPDPDGPVITPLGRWAAARICADLPTPASPQLPPVELIAEFARFADEDQQWHVAWGWLAGRDPLQAAREILTAAEQVSPIQRFRAVVVVEHLAERALPAWREAAQSATVGPHARAVLAAMDQGPEPGDADWRWLAVEAAAAALAERGPDEALSRVCEAMPGDGLDEQVAAVLATGHPSGVELTRAVAAFAVSGAPRSLDQIVALKVALSGTRPAVWRRVQVPATATLGDLHMVIQVLYGWGGDHLHVFGVGKQAYGDPFVDLGDARDEDDVRLGRLAASGSRRFSYTYDLGACWEHEVTLEAVMAREPGRDYPACTAFRGDSPQEYEFDDEHRAFDLSDINGTLAARFAATHA